MPEDDGLLGLAMKSIEQLNSRHGNDRFLLFHRPRVWCETEDRWIGWERKRGKLEELNILDITEENSWYKLGGTALSWTQHEKTEIVVCMGSYGVIA